MYRCTRPRRNLCKSSPCCPHIHSLLFLFYLPRWVLTLCASPPNVMRLHFSVLLLFLEARGWSHVQPHRSRVFQGPLHPLLVPSAPLLESPQPHWLPAAPWQVWQAQDAGTTWALPGWAVTLQLLVTWTPVTPEPGRCISGRICPPLPLIILPQGPLPPSQSTGNRHLQTADPKQENYLGFVIPCLCIYPVTWSIFSVQKLK